jgi:hypothetical protein
MSFVTATATEFELQSVSVFVWATVSRRSFASAMVIPMDSLCMFETETGFWSNSASDLMSGSQSGTWSKSASGLMCATGSEIESVFGYLAASGIGFPFESVMHLMSGSETDTGLTFATGLKSGFDLAIVSE